MIDFALDTKSQEIIERYKAFTDEWIIPRRAEYDRCAIFPHDVVAAALKQGLLNPCLPIRFGGAGYNVLECALASEQLGYGCLGIAISLDANQIALIPLLQAATEEQQKRLFGYVMERNGLAAFCLTEPDAGSDVAAIKSTAVRKGDKYILNGHKRFITNGDQASIHTVFALSDPEKGARSLSCLVVPRDAPGVKIVSTLEKMGQRASCQNEIIYENVEVPVENMIGGEGRGFRIAMGTLERTRIGVAAVAVGLAKAAFDYSKEWAKNRKQFGKPIVENQAIAFMFADMAMEIEKASLMMHKAGWAYDQGIKNVGFHSAMAKIATTDAAMKVSMDAVQIMGGEGYSTMHPVEKMMRDAKLTQIYEGTNQVQRVVMAKKLFN